MILTIHVPKILRVNDLYRVSPTGRTYKTPAHREYQHTIAKQLERQGCIDWDPEERVMVRIEFYLRSRLETRDVDGLGKSLIDGVCAALGFDDNRIYELTLSKYEQPPELTGETIRMYINPF